ncbi:Uncharacterized protein APZ42_016729 [Daphnia magna]|uniref:Secreted protein n=1 Tax=Daphnia magna TaxID=35525 RepID=A0A165A467_9CRUS|nr:Uncharacterized protein APZ42_016729 [Daphnia magna]
MFSGREGKVVVVVFCFCFCICVLPIKMKATHIETGGVCVWRCFRLGGCYASSSISFGPRLSKQSGRFRS